VCSLSFDWQTEIPCYAREIESRKGSMCNPKMKQLMRAEIRNYWCWFLLFAPFGLFSSRSKSDVFSRHRLGRESQLKQH
jgi:hypothetical protein